MRVRQIRRERPEVVRFEAGASREGHGLVGILPPRDGAGRVDHGSAGTNETPGPIEELGLQVEQPLDRLGTLPPSRVGARRQGSEIRTGGIDQHPVEVGEDFGAPPIGLDDKSVVVTETVQRRGDVIGPGGIGLDGDDISVVADGRSDSTGLDTGA